MIQQGLIRHVLAACLAAGVIVPATGVAQVAPETQPGETVTAEPTTAPEQHYQPKITPEEVLRSPEGQAAINEFLNEYYKEFFIPNEEWGLWEKFPDGTVKYVRGGDVMQVVRSDEKGHWVRQISIDDPRAKHGREAYGRILKDLYGRAVWREYLSDKHFFEPESFVPPPFVDELTFEDVSQGLPANGLWQISADVADINRDGRPDIILPPARKGDGVPHIFLGTDKGWAETRLSWPKDAALDYGAVAVEDFDRDGNLDIALACHFKRSWVLFGNGKGDFSRAVAMPDTQTTFRSLAVADFTGDGLPDIAALAEIDLDQVSSKIRTSNLLVVFANPGKANAPWRVIDAAKGTVDLMGDSVTALDIDGDGDRDLLVAATKRSPAVLFLNEGNGERWRPVVTVAYPYAAYAFATAALPGAGPAGDVAVLSVLQRERRDMAAKRDVNALITMGLKAPVSSDPNDPANWQVSVINLFEQAQNRYCAVAVGDVNGDGEDDLIAGRDDGSLEVYLRRGGTWYSEQGEDLNLGERIGRVHSIVVRDVNGDGLGDIVALVGAASDKGGGQVRAYVSRARKSPGA